MVRLERGDWESVEGWAGSAGKERRFAREAILEARA